MNQQGAVARRMQRPISAARIFFESEFVRYFFVSLAAFVLDLSLFSVGLRVLHIAWAVSATFGFLGGVLVAYFLSVRFVFRSRKFRNKPATELLTFSTVGLGGLLVTQLVLWVGIELMGSNPEISKVSAAGFTFLFNFMVRKLLLFRSALHSSPVSGNTHDLPPK